MEGASVKPEDVDVKFLQEERKDLDEAKKRLKKALAAAEALEKASDDAEKSIAALKQISKAEQDL
jgi:hypothetical protein